MTLPFGRGCTADLEGAPLVGAQEGVARLVPGVPLGQVGLDLLRRQHLLAVDRQEDVADADPGAVRRAARGDPPRDDALRRGFQKTPSSRASRWP